jgi:tyrosyl-tRNA synthetase
MNRDTTTQKEITEELLTRSVQDSVGVDVLREKMLRGEKLRVKLGIDPTSPHIHLGRAVQLLKLRDFQQAGHQIVFIVGDFTGVIGDTSDKESERPMLTQQAVRDNMRSYVEQASVLLDMEQTEVHYNSEWLGKLTYTEIGEHADLFSVADFTSRENIKKRLDAGKRVSLREVLYPLMQGYDSVVVRADVEIGGTDQRFNLLAGRSLQTHYGQKPQAILMHELLPGLDGRKMSSSWGNTIQVRNAPDDMYGKVMSLRDELVVSYFTHTTRVSQEDVAQIARGLVGGAVHPRDAKMRLAREVVSLYHGDVAARAAEEAFVRTFQDGGMPEEMPEFVTQKGSGLVDVLLHAGIISSKGEWRRLVQGGGVHVQGVGTQEMVTVQDEYCAVTETIVVRIGKRRFIRVAV